MIDMLLTKSVFIGSKTDFCTQLTGLDASSNLTFRGVPTALAARHVVHQRRISPQAKLNHLCSHQNILRSRCTKSPREGHIWVAQRTYLSPICKSHPDVLNRYNDGNGPAHAKHISKYIFPRQFGLHNVFTHATDRRETRHAFRDYTDREGEIQSSRKSRDKKAYGRLEARIVPLIQKMQRSHRDCSYHALLHHYCSAETESGMAVDGEVSFGNGSSSNFFTQNELTLTSAGSLTGDEMQNGDSDLLRHHTCHHQVCPNHCV
jgi:hypothetical protein